MEFEDVTDFDYEIPHTCEYEVGHGDCGEPAPYYVWWERYDDGMWVCQKHFSDIKRSEE